MKCNGSWTRKRHEQLASSVDHLQVSVEGPYGPTSSHFLSCESLVLNSGGSGITPFISIIQEIAFRSTQPRFHILCILFVCAFKEDLNMLISCSPYLAPKQTLPG